MVAAGGLTGRTASECPPKCQRRQLGACECPLLLHKPPLGNGEIKLLNPCEPASPPTERREEHLVCKAAEGGRGILRQGLTEAGTRQLSYLTADDAECAASWLRCGKNARGKSSKALDITNESANLRIQR